MVPCWRTPRWCVSAEAILVIESRLSSELIGGRRQQNVDILIVASASSASSCSLGSELAFQLSRRWSQAVPVCRAYQVGRATQQLVSGSSERELARLLAWQDRETVLTLIWGAGTSRGCDLFMRSYSTNKCVCVRVRAFLPCPFPHQTPAWPPKCAYLTARICQSS